MIYFEIVFKTIQKVVFLSKAHHRYLHYRRPKLVYFKVFFVGWKNINFYRQILFHLQLEKLFLSSYLGRETQSNLTFLSLTTILYKRDQTLSPKVLGTSMTFYNQLWVSHRIALNLNGLSNLQLLLRQFCKSSSSATSEYSTC